MYVERFHIKMHRGSECFLLDSESIENTNYAWSVLLPDLELQSFKPRVKELIMNQVRKLNGSHYEVFGLFPFLWYLHVYNKNNIEVRH